MDHRIQVVCSELESDPSRGLQITALSRSVNLSSSRFRHLFKAETGQTLVQYRKRVRLEEARVLLGTTLLSVKEIMHRVGVGSNSHFAHDFKEACGLSPTQYRARSQESHSIDRSFRVSANSDKE
jgi:AraC family transcriptional regulator of arabinose operon